MRILGIDPGIAIVGYGVIDACRGKFQYGRVLPAGQKRFAYNGGSCHWNYRRYGNFKTDKRLHRQIKSKKANNLSIFCSDKLKNVNNLRIFGSDKLKNTENSYHDRLRRCGKKYRFSCKKCGNSRYIFQSRGVGRGS